METAAKSPAVASTDPDAAGEPWTGDSTFAELTNSPIGNRQFLKWLGNKQRMAAHICGWFPRQFGQYYEPFVGSGAVLGTLAPRKAVAGDALGPLVELWQWLQRDPAGLCAAYAERHTLMQVQDADRAHKQAVYAAIRQRYNAGPNPADLLFLARTCYGGVIRFDRTGKMNTPCGIHQPVSPQSMLDRCAVWQPRVAGTQFVHADFADLLQQAQAGDLVYCDPPYADSQKALYGAHIFSLDRLWQTVDDLRSRGVYVALSIDGSKRSGRHDCGVLAPQGLFVRDVQVQVGKSMLRRFQMEGQTMHGEHVADRLLLTW